MLGMPRTAFQLSDGTMKYLVQNGAHEGVHCFALLGRESAQPASEAFQLSLPDQTHSLLKRQDSRHYVACRQASRHLLEFFVNDRLGPDGFPLALFHIGIDHLLEIIDVIYKYVIQLVDGGIDVSWHGDVHEEDRAAAPGREQSLGL